MFGRSVGGGWGPGLALAGLIWLLPAAWAGAQEISLRRLLTRPERIVDTVAGYEAEAGWPAGHDEAAHGAWGEMSAIDVDRDGRIWTLNRGSLPVRVYTSDGQLVRAWGSDLLRRPHGLGLAPDGTVWIADAGAHVVVQFSDEGRRLRTLGVAGEPGDDPAHFDQPTDVAIAADGTIYVADGYGNNRVVVFAPDGSVRSILGSEGTAPGQFRLPHALALDSQGRLYVADRSNARVQVFAPDGSVLAEWRNLIVPWDLAIDRADRVYVAGSSPTRWPRGARTRAGVPLGIPPHDQIVFRFDTSGRAEELWSFPLGDRPGMVDWVHGLAVDGEGHLYLGDIQGRRVQKFRRLEATDRPPERPSR
ncbi:MAG: hypothetical protein KatS3mg108_3793 [Isosphaeraceae bacterium]|jgi:sugar lactone lactonase YvrE|nr:MAG: hypothetical protein KatS3mg108_3793 [Isosphaeraceae bacterium]